VEALTPSFSRVLLRDRSGRPAHAHADVVSLVIGPVVGPTRQIADRQGQYVIQETIGRELVVHRSGGLGFGDGLIVVVDEARCRRNGQRHAGSL
jgi:hypothetical protein